MSTDALGMEDMSSALTETTNTAAPVGTIKNEEAHNLAREKGWAEPQDYNYDAYNASNKAVAENDALGTEWNHNAAKYEWKEEYGDVGPAMPELEHQLFRSEFINRQGLKFDK